MSLAVATATGSVEALPYYAQTSSIVEEESVMKGQLTSPIVLTV
jgi:hypothetical protein